MLEEITDNRPRTINLTKNYGEEGAPAFKGSTELAKYIETFLLNVQVFRVDRETQDETVTDEFPLDISALLFETLPDKQHTFKFDKL